MNKETINIVIAGQGGQGVNTLHKIILQLCSMKGLPTKSSLLKGGAQRHGSVSSTIRVFLQAREEYQWFSSQIRAGELNALLGLDPWEALRFHKLLGHETQLWINTRNQIAYSARLRDKQLANPLDMYEEIVCRKKMEDYSGQAMETFGDVRMTNYLLGKDFVVNNILPFSEAEFVEQFIKLVRPDGRIISLITEDLN